MVQPDLTKLTIRMLIERLNWPVRMARWRTAREFSSLLSSKDYSKLATDVYLDWLSGRKFESEVGSALAVLLCTSENSLPPFEVVADHITKPSILADAMLENIYGSGKVKEWWKHAHSGQPPPSFKPEPYFLNNKFVYAPPIFSEFLEDIEAKTGFPLMKQWAFEWHKLMESTGTPRSKYPYYFVEPSRAHRGISALFSQRQWDVYQSAYLRTLARAVDYQVLSADCATVLALQALPLNRGLAQLNPAERPAWISNIPEKCVDVSNPLEPLVRNLLKSSLGQRHMRPVVLKTPIPADLAEFSALSISAVLASADFVPDLNVEHSVFAHAQSCILPDGVSIECALEKKNISDFTSSGISGFCSPLCLDLWPCPIGSWLTDYFLSGISLPASYAFEDEAEIVCNNDRIDIISSGNISASWKVWHDCWTPLYACGGSTRCGMLTELREDEIAKAQDRHGMRLGWFVELNIWEQEKDFELTRRREFFFD